MKLKWGDKVIYNAVVYGKLERRYGYYQGSIRHTIRHWRVSTHVQLAFFREQGSGRGIKVPLSRLEKWKEGRDRG